MSDDIEPIVVDFRRDKHLGTRYRAAAKDIRPRIEFNEINLPAVLDKSQEALAASGAPIYHQSGRLVYVFRLDRDSSKDDAILRKSGALLIHDISKPRLREYLIKHIEYHKLKEGVEVTIPAPVMLAAHMLARQDKWRFRVLTGIIECPTILDDGTLLATAGYHAKSGLMLDLEQISLCLNREDSQRLVNEQGCRC